MGSAASNMPSLRSRPRRRRESEYDQSLFVCDVPSSSRVATVAKSRWVFDDDVVVVACFLVADGEGTRDTRAQLIISFVHSIMRSVDGPSELGIAHICRAGSNLP